LCWQAEDISPATNESTLFPAAGMLPLAVQFAIESNLKHVAVGDEFGFSAIFIPF
jgi:hypothetical protein